MTICLRSERKKLRKEKQSGVINISAHKTFLCIFQKDHQGEVIV